MAKILSNKMEIQKGNHKVTSNLIFRCLKVFSEVDSIYQPHLEILAKGSKDLLYTQPNKPYQVLKKASDRLEILKTKIGFKSKNSQNDSKKSKNERKNEENQKIEEKNSKKLTKNEQHFSEKNSQKSDSKSFFKASEQLSGSEFDEETEVYQGQPLIEVYEETIEKVKSLANELNTLIRYLGVWLGEHQKAVSELQDQNEKLTLDFCSYKRILRKRYDLKMEDIQKSLFDAVASKDKISRHNQTLMSLLNMPMFHKEDKEPKGVSGNRKKEIEEEKLSKEENQKIKKIEKNEKIENLKISEIPKSEPEEGVGTDPEENTYLLLSHALQDLAQKDSRIVVLEKMVEKAAENSRNLEEQLVGLKVDEEILQLQLSGYRNELEILKGKLNITEKDYREILRHKHQSTNPILLDLLKNFCVLSPSSKTKLRGMEFEDQIKFFKNQLTTFLKQVLDTLKSGDSMSTKYLISRIRRVV